MSLRLAKGAGSHEIMQNIFADLSSHPFGPVRSRIGRTADLVIEHLLDVPHDRGHHAINRRLSVKTIAPSRPIEASLQAESRLRPTFALHIFPPLFQLESPREIPGKFR